MKGNGSGAVLEGVRRVFDGGSVAGLGPGPLLERFVERGDDEAFAAIVARHGPMVLGVCRRALRDPGDVEDAYQATFLVLVRRAGSIRDGEALGAWLHGVARKVSTRARAVAIRRRGAERTGLEVEPAGDAPDPERAERLAIVDEEVARLPGPYRRAIVACDLEGCPQPEASARLGWTEGSLRGRLARGRALLRSRLARRGLAGGVTLAAPTLADAALAARLAAPLLMNAAPRVEISSTAAVALANQFLEASSMTKIALITLSGLALGASLAGLGVASVRGQQAAQAPKPPAGAAAPSPSAAPKAVANPAEPAGAEEPGEVMPPPPDNVHFDGVADPPPRAEMETAPPAEPAESSRLAVGDLLLVEVLETLSGRPLTGERPIRADGTASLQWYGDVKLVGLTRREAKVKIIEQMRRYLTDQTLGLVVWDDREGRWWKVHPAWSDRVFVDVVQKDQVRPSPISYQGDLADPIDAKLAPIRRELEALRKERRK